MAHGSPQDTGDGSDARWEPRLQPTPDPRPQGSGGTPGEDRGSRAPEQPQRVGRPPGGQLWAVPGDRVSCPGVEGTQAHGTWPGLLQGPAFRAEKG